MESCLPMATASILYGRPLQTAVAFGPGRYPGLFDWPLDCALARGIEGNDDISAGIWSSPYCSGKSRQAGRLGHSAAEIEFQHVQACPRLR